MEGIELEATLTNLQSDIVLLQYKVGQLTKIVDTICRIFQIESAKNVPVLVNPGPEEVEIEAKRLLEEASVVTQKIKEKKK